MRDVRYYRWKSELPLSKCQCTVITCRYEPHIIWKNLKITRLFIAVPVLQSGNLVPVGQLLQPSKSSQEAEVGHSEQSGNKITVTECVDII